MKLQVDEILKKTGAAKVHIIAHSMGGLDARHMISNLGYEDQVASLTSIAVPHRGSPAADFYVDYTGDWLDSIVVSSMISLMGVSAQVEPDFRAVLTALSTEHLEGFNARTPDMKGVYYQSWAGFSSITGTTWLDSTRGELQKLCEVGKQSDGDYELLTADVMSSWLSGMEPIVALGDGLVEINSAKWGVFRGCLPTDHLGLVGFDHSPNNGFDYTEFYLGMAAELQGRSLDNVLTISPGDLTLSIGDTLKSEVLLNGRLAEGPMAWTSGNSAVVSVSPSGLLTAHKHGNVTISVNRADGASGTMSVVVRAPSECRLPEAENNESCADVYQGQDIWRCVTSESLGGVPVSQVCRDSGAGARWTNFHTNPVECCACDGDFNVGCCAADSGSYGCP